MGTNYYDAYLFRTTEENLNIYIPEMPIALQYINLPSTTYAQYKTELTNQYNLLTPLQKIVCDFHMSALTEVVSSGITTDPDYWSASSINGSYIINSGLTTSRVGIGTMNPSYTLTVSGDIGINEYIYHNGDANTYIRLQDDHLNLVAGGKSMVRLDMGATQDKVEINNTNADIDLRVMDDGGNTILSTDAENTRVGVNNIIPNHALSVSGTVSASSSLYATTLYSGTTDISTLIGAGGSTDVYWSASSVDGTFIVNSGLTTSKVGIGTTIPNHELSVSGTVSASSSLYASTLYSGTTDISTLIGAAGGGSTDVYWGASSVDGTFIINSGVTSTANPNKVGVGTMIPNKELSVSGTISASTSIFVGSDCIIKSPESGSVFIGDDAGANWEAGTTSATAVGRLAMGLGTLDSAKQNTAIGFASLAYITTGDYNTALGLQSNTSIDTGSYNTSIGKTSMFGATYHSYNTAVGANTMYFTTSSSLGKTVPTDTHNTAIGYSSQYYNLNGAYNTSVGSQSIGNSSIAYAGTGSTAMGYKALFSNTTGNYNVALGYQAGDNITTGDYNISIGTNADPASATADYQLNIGGVIVGKDLVGNNLSINAVGVGTGATAGVITHTLTVSGDTLINGDLVCSGDIDGGSF